VAKTRYPCFWNVNARAEPMPPALVPVIKIDFGLMVRISGKLRLTMFADRRFKGLMELR